MFTNFFESAKLRVLLVHVPRALRALEQQVPHALSVLILHMPCILRALMLHLPHALHTLLLTTMISNLC